MKKLFIFTIVLSALLFSTDSCKKDKEITCNLNAGSEIAAQDMMVMYSASSSGDGTISSLTYASDSGLVTVNNPVLPWLLTVTISHGNTMSLTASGTVKDGTLEVKFEAAGGIQIIENVDGCSHSN